MGILMTGAGPEKSLRVAFSYAFMSDGAIKRSRKKQGSESQSFFSGKRTRTEGELQLRKDAPMGILTVNAFVTLVSLYFSSRVNLFLTIFRVRPGNSRAIISKSDPNCCRACERGRGEEGWGRGGRDDEIRMWLR